MYPLTKVLRLHVVLGTYKSRVSQDVLSTYTFQSGGVYTQNVGRVSHKR